MDQERRNHILRLIAENDDQIAFEEFVKYYYPGLLSFSNSIIKNNGVAQELLNDIFVRVWQNRKAINTIQNIPNYLYTSAKHACFKYSKDQKKIFSTEISEDALFTFTDPEEQFISKDNIEKINTVINNLPPKCQLIFRLIKEERLKYEEVAELLGLSVKTINSQMYIAIKQLSKELLLILPELKTNFLGKKPAG